jgi:hypothetical protein
MVTQRKRRTGPPIIEPREGEKATLGVRATPNLKRELVAAAAHNGASLSEECVSRLKFSFDYEKIERRMTQITDILALLHRILQALEAIERRLKKRDGPIRFVEVDDAPPPKQPPAS